MRAVCNRGSLGAAFGFLTASQFNVVQGVVIERARVF